jgi:hypothetical protein
MRLAAAGDPGAHACAGVSIAGIGFNPLGNREGIMVRAGLQWPSDRDR